MRINSLTDKQKLMLNTATIQKHRKVDRQSVSATATASVVHSHPIRRRNATNEPNSRDSPLATFGQHVVLSIKQPAAGSDDDQVFNDDEEDENEEHDDDEEEEERLQQHQSPSATRKLFARTMMMASGQSPKRATASQHPTEEASGEAEKAAATSTSSKISMRTKYLLTSFLKFKRTLRAKRRNSSSCSDLFVI